MPCQLPCDGKENKKTYEAFGTDPMEILYQRRCANFIYVAPQGLRELMSDISREVIREQPKNLNSFIADYLHTLMITRENAKVAIRFVEDVGDTGELLADLMEHTNLTRYKIDKSARIIQRTFRRLVKKRRYRNTEVIQEIAIDKIMERLKVTLEEANKAATVIQHAYHLYKLRQERRYRAQEEPDLHRPFRHIDWLIAAQRTFNIFTNIRGVCMCEFHNAAVQIQAAYRGYYTRKFLKDYWNFMKNEEKKMDPDDDTVKRKKDRAARILQSFFRKLVKEIKRKKRVQLVTFEKSRSPEHPRKPSQAESPDATTSVDIAEIEDRSARIIQRFFRRIVFQKKTRFTYDHEFTDIQYNSAIDEMDTEIETIFEEEEEC